MTSTKFSVSLRIFHPSIDPDSISRKIDVEATRRWRVGEPKTTPTGERLIGVNHESYWCGSLPLRNRRRLGSALSEAVDRLSRHRSFLREVEESGGKAELFIGCFSNGDWGAELLRASGGDGPRGRR